MTTKRPPLDFDAIRYHAQGRWLDCIFQSFGIEFVKAPHLHQPCPICGGRDRFRCDDNGGRGTWICNKCGSGTGFKLVELYTGLSGYELMAAVGETLGVGAAKSLSNDERAAWRAKVKAEQAAQRERDLAAKYEQYAATAKRAQALWAQSHAVDGHHPYLQRKCIAGTYLRQDADALIVPLYHTDITAGTHELVNIQRIMPNGDKRFLKGGRQKDCYFILGVPSEAVFIGEGVATCGAVFESFGGVYMTVCAFNAGNLMGVGRVIRHLLPNARIIFIADDDAATEAGAHGENTGVVKAQAAADAIGAVVARPSL